MAKFCTRCGKPINEGEVCSCVRESMNMQADYKQGFFEAFKNFVGIGDPEINKGDTYEKGRRIVPDCIKSNEGEIPVKQYELATLQSRLFGIPYAKAKGRLQVTNKRVVFRAPGRSLLGRTTLQHEFAIDELGGIEVRREYYFSFWDFIGAAFVAGIGSSLLTTILAAVDSEVLMFILSLMVAAAGLVPMFRLKKLWLLKILCLGCSVGGCYGMMMACSDSDFLTVLVGLPTLAISLLLLLMTTIWAIRPNLVFIIKNKSSHDTIDIKRRSAIKGLMSFFSQSGETEHTGYSEVLPGDDAELCIKEINAMITDIQKLGDFGIEKWKE